jgi:acyl transferase domain-containing protein
MSEPSVILMFSGQGSQYYQMGRAFFDGNAGFRRGFLQLNAIAEPMLGRSLVDVLYNDGRTKDQSFDDIALTSAAIFVVEFALAKVLLEDGIRPAYLLGASMGVYAAAAVAGALDPGEALECLAKMAAVYQEQCPKGTMLAILGSPRLHRELLHDISDLAAVNFESHFVISTTAAHIDEITAILNREKIIFQEIPVGFAFHSRWIDGASEAALTILRSLQYRSPRIPLICCAQAAAVETVSAEMIWNTVRRPIEFERTIAALEQRAPRHYIDVGPAGTLANFVKYALPSSSASMSYSILSPFGSELQNYDRLLTQRSLFEDPSGDARQRSFRDGSTTASDGFFAG